MGCTLFFILIICLPLFIVFLCSIGSSDNSKNENNNQKPIGEIKIDD